MAVSKEVADKNFGSLKLDVSKWFDKRKYGVGMLKVLYRDHIGNTIALHECSKTKDILDLLIGAGHLTPDNLTILYETINVTQQFGLAKKIKDRHPSFLKQNDIKNIAITEFTQHRQRLVNLGMALTPDEIQDIGDLYNVAEERTTDSWSLIMELEQRMIICEGEMEAFIGNLKKNEIPKAVNALTKGATLFGNKHKHTASSLDSVSDPPQKKHKPYTSETIQQFKETLAALEKDANHCKNKLQYDVWASTNEAAKLEQHKDKSLRDIDNHVEEMVKKIKENGDKMKDEVESMYNKKKKVLDVHMNELRATISEIDTKLSFVNELLKSDEPTTQSSETIITALKARINDLPKTLPNDGRQIYFLINKEPIAFLQQCDIGNIKYLGTADCLRLQGIKSVTQGQKIVVKIIKTDECNIPIHTNQLKATWTQPTEETYIAHVDEDDNGNYFVIGKCPSPGVCTLDVSADGKPIKQSPMMIKVEKEGLVNTIEIYGKHIKDVVMCEDDCLLISCLTNEILVYNQFGRYIDKVTLPQGVQVNRMFKMKNGNIAFSDFSANCIKVCNMNGQVTKSIGQQVSMNPSGMYMDETSNVAFVGGFNNSMVLMIDIDSGEMIKRIGSQGIQIGQMMGIRNVTLTKQRHLLVLEFENNRLQRFDNKGRSIKILVEAGDEDGKVRNPRGVVVDEDDNIIISSWHKLQLFSSDGNFIKRIDKPEDGIYNPCGLSIISFHPRRLAVANSGKQNIKIFNY